MEYSRKPPKHKHHRHKVVRSLSSVLISRALIVGSGGKIDRKFAPCMLTKPVEAPYLPGLDNYHFGVYRPRPASRTPFAPSKSMTPKRPKRPIYSVVVVVPCGRLRSLNRSLSRSWSDAFPDSTSPFLSHATSSRGGHSTLLPHKWRIHQKTNDNDLITRLSRTNVIITGKFHHSIDLVHIESTD